MRKCFGVGIFFVKCCCDLVHANVGTLRGKYCRNDQLKRIFMFQFADCIRIGLVQFCQNCGHPFGIRWVRCSAASGDFLPGTVFYAGFLRFAGLAFFVLAMSARLQHARQNLQQPPKGLSAMAMEIFFGAGNVRQTTCSEQGSRKPDRSQSRRTLGASRE